MVQYLLVHTYIKRHRNESESALNELSCGCNAGLIPKKEHMHTSNVSSFAPVVCHSAFFSSYSFEFNV